eukprot:scaffold66968_cov57-Phaeocystis_antarctica.AAC.2
MAAPPRIRRAAAPCCGPGPVHHVVHPARGLLANEGEVLQAARARRHPSVKHLLLGHVAVLPRRVGDVRSELLETIEVRCRPKVAAGLAQRRASAPVHARQSGAAHPRR